MSSRLIRTDLSGVHEHIDAMVAARTASERVTVLESVQRLWLAGQRLECRRHAGVWDFAGMAAHLSRVPPHDRGDITPAEPDPRELGRSSDR